MGIRISEMEEATTFGADDYVPIVTNGTNKKALGTKIKDFIANYFVKKTGDTFPASSVTYDNTTSGLSAANAQSAIDEVNELSYKAKQYSTSVGVDNMHGNDYNGLYWMDKTSWSGMPQGSYGYLEVCGNLQKFYPYGGTGLAELYVRMYANAVWNSWKRVQSTSNASITRQSGVSSSVPIPDIDRRGNVVIISFAHQFPAGTYYQLYDVSPKPIRSEYAIVDHGTNTTVIDLFTNGTMRFKTSMTFTANQYVLGQLVYLTDE